MSKLYDTDGIDGPFERAMSRAIGDSLRRDDVTMFKTRPNPKTRFTVVRHDGGTYAAPTLSEALDLAMPDKARVMGDGIPVYHGPVYATDAGAARLMHPRTWRDVSEATLKRHWRQYQD